MGYYSEVAIAFTKEGHEKFTALLAAKMLESKENFDGETPFDILNEGEKKEYANGAVSYFWPYIKWYSDFLSVASIMEALEELESDCFKFARCGEEYGDCEDMGDMQGPPYLNFETSLNIWD